MPPEWVMILKDLGPGGLVTFIVVLVLTGRLVPRQLLIDKQKEVEDWKTAYRDVSATSIKSSGQIEQLLELARTSDAFIRSVHDHADKRAIWSQQEREDEK